MGRGTVYNNHLHFIVSHEMFIVTYSSIFHYLGIKFLYFSKFFYGMFSNFNNISNKDGITIDSC